MATLSRSITSTPRNPPRFRKAPFCAALTPGSVGVLPHPQAPAAVVVEEIPTLPVEDVPMLPVEEVDVPTLPVEHSPTIMPTTIEEPVRDRAPGRSPFIPVHFPTKIAPAPSGEDCPKRKRKRAEVGALERAIDKASSVKRRKREGGGGAGAGGGRPEGLERAAEKENVKVKRRVGVLPPSHFPPGSPSTFLISDIYACRGWLESP